MLSAFLGLALTFAPPLYGYYESLPERLWGISAAKDQNLGGILMTTEQALILFAAVVWLLVRLFREEDEAEAALQAEQQRAQGCPREARPRPWRARRRGSCTRSKPVIAVPSSASSCASFAFVDLMSARLAAICCWTIVVR